MKTDQKEALIALAKGEYIEFKTDDYDAEWQMLHRQVEVSILNHNPDIKWRIAPDSNILNAYHKLKEPPSDYNSFKAGYLAGKDSKNMIEDLFSEINKTFA